MILAVFDQLTAGTPCMQRKTLWASTSFDDYHTSSLQLFTGWVITSNCGIFRLRNAYAITSTAKTASEHDSQAPRRTIRLDPPIGKPFFDRIRALHKPQHCIFFSETRYHSHDHVYVFEKAGYFTDCQLAFPLAAVGTLWNGCFLTSLVLHFPGYSNVSVSQTCE